MESLNMWIYMAWAGFLIFEAALLTSFSLGKKYRIITSALHCHSHYKCFTWHLIKCVCSPAILCSEALWPCQRRWCEVFPGHPEQWLGKHTVKTSFRWRCRVCSGVCPYLYAACVGKSTCTTPLTHLCSEPCSYTGEGREAAFGMGSLILLLDVDHCRSCQYKQALDIGCYLPPRMSHGTFVTLMCHARAWHGAAVSAWGRAWILPRCLVYLCHGPSGSGSSALLCVVQPRLKIHGVHVRYPGLAS